MLKKMEWVARAIAQPYEVQLTLFPDFVEVAEELVLCWEEAFESVMRVKDAITPEQMAAFKALDDYLLSVDRSGKTDIWTMKALEGFEEWRHIRVFAQELLTAMNWSMTSPGRSTAIYYREGDI